MRGSHRILSILALGTLLLLAPSCSTDSPTAPAQDPPPPGGGTTPTNWRITVTADPDELFKFEPDSINGINCGGEPANLKIKVESPVDGSVPVNGTTILVSANIGSFIGAATPVREIALELTGGVALAQFFACQTPGVAQVVATLGSSVGQVSIEISPDPFDARFAFSNPDVNNSVSFTNTSSGDFTSLTWRFGDGTQSTEINPHHVYPAPGIYNVKLTIKRGQNTDVCELTVSTAEASGNCPPTGLVPPPPPPT